MFKVFIFLLLIFTNWYSTIPTNTSTNTSTNDDSKCIDIGSVMRCLRCLQWVVQTKVDCNYFDLLQVLCDTFKSGRQCVIVLFF